MTRFQNRNFLLKNTTCLDVKKQDWQKFGHFNVKVHIPCQLVKSEQDW